MKSLISKDFPSYLKHLNYILDFYVFYDELLKWHIQSESKIRNPSTSRFLHDLSGSPVPLKLDTYFSNVGKFQLIDGKQYYYLNITRCLVIEVFKRLFSVEHQEGREYMTQIDLSHVIKEGEKKPLISVMSQYTQIGLPQLATLYSNIIFDDDHPPMASEVDLLLGICEQILMQMPDILDNYYQNIQIAYEPILRKLTLGDPDKKEKEDRESSILKKRSERKHLSLLYAPQNGEHLLRYYEKYELQHFTRILAEYSRQFSCANNLVALSAATTNFHSWWEILLVTTRLKIAECILPFGVRATNIPLSGQSRIIWHIEQTKDRVVHALDLASTTSQILKQFDQSPNIDIVFGEYKAAWQSIFNILQSNLPFLHGHTQLPRDRLTVPQCSMVEQGMEKFLRLFPKSPFKEREAEIVGDRSKEAAWRVVISSFILSYKLLRQLDKTAYVESKIINAINNPVDCAVDEMQQFLYIDGLLQALGESFSNLGFYRTAVSQPIDLGAHSEMIRFMRQVREYRNLRTHHHLHPDNDHSLTNIMEYFQVRKVELCKAFWELGKSIMVGHCKIIEDVSNDVAITWEPITQNSFVQALGVEAPQDLEADIFKQSANAQCVLL